MSIGKVTALYEAAKLADWKLDSGPARRAMEPFQEVDDHGRVKENVAYLAALDAVAAQPERAKLAAWVVGLSTDDVTWLHSALNLTLSRASAAVDDAGSEVLNRLAEGLLATMDDDAESTSHQRKPVVLPAGKPPPFLLVGMVLQKILDGPEPRPLLYDVVVAKPRNGQVAIRSHGRTWSPTHWVPVEIALSWPLAEPFTVEEE